MSCSTLALVLSAMSALPALARDGDATKTDPAATEASPADAPEEASSPGQDLHWPIVLVKPGIGFPFPLSARMEVFPIDGLSLEAGVTAPFLIPGTIGGGVRWRPRFTCLGCEGHLQLRPGIGLEGHTFYGFDGIPTVFDPPEWLVVVSPGVTALWRVIGRIGVTFGIRLAMGVTSGFEAPTRIEPTGYLNIELGAVVL